MGRSPVQDQEQAGVLRGPARLAPCPSPSPRSWRARPSCAQNRREGHRGAQTRRLGRGRTPTAPEHEPQSTTTTATRMPRCIQVIFVDVLSLALRVTPQIASTQSSSSSVASRPPLERRLDGVGPSPYGGRGWGARDRAQGRVKRWARSTPSQAARRKAAQQGLPPNTSSLAHEAGA
ncbi:hypothetical protein C8R46DRAFT_1081122 [Mycena filopes]|nr:hypothetical protein C8R46DRAFT_1081122 [Mycena filopes]